MKISEFIRNLSKMKNHKIEIVTKLWKERVSLINILKSNINNEDMITKINQIKPKKRNQIIFEYLNLSKLNYHQSCKSLKINCYYSTLNKNASSTYLTEINVNENQLEKLSNEKIKIHRVPKRNYNRFNWIPSDKELNMMILKAAGFLEVNEECPELILLEQNLKRAFIK